MELTEQQFARLISDVIARHPEWMTTVQTAIQNGIAAALVEERSKVTDLAYAMSVMVRKHPKTVDKNLGFMQDGMGILADFFRGSAFGNEIAHYKNEVSNG